MYYAFNLKKERTKTLKIIESWIHCVWVKPCYSGASYIQFRKNGGEILWAETHTHTVRSAKSRGTNKYTGRTAAAAGFRKWIALAACAILNGSNIGATQHLHTIHIHKFLAFCFHIELVNNTVPKENYADTLIYPTPKPHDIE